MFRSISISMIRAFANNTPWIVEFETSYPNIDSFCLVSQHDNTAEKYRPILSRQMDMVVVSFYVNEYISTENDKHNQKYNNYSSR